MYTVGGTDEILGLIKTRVRKDITLDGHGMAVKAGNPLSLNMVILGAPIGSGAVHVKPNEMHKTISAFTKKAFLEFNLRTFDMGVEHAESKEDWVD